MAIAVNSTSAPALTSTSSSTVSAAFNNTAGTFLVAAVFNAGDPTAAPTAMTYGGVALTAHHNTARSNFLSGDWRYLVSPATGSNTFAVTFAASKFRILVVLQTFTGVDLVTPVRTSTTPVKGTTGTMTIGMTSVSGDTVWSALAAYDVTALTASTGTEQSGVENGDADGTRTSCSILVATGTTTTMTWTSSGARSAFDLGGMSLIPASEASGNPWPHYAQQREQTRISRRWERVGLLWTPSYVMERKVA